MSGNSVSRTVCFGWRAGAASFFLCVFRFSTVVSCKKYGGGRCLGGALCDSPDTYFLIFVRGASNGFRNAAFPALLRTAAARGGGAGSPVGRMTPEVSGWA